MTHILHRQIGHRYPAAASGQGAMIRDSEGKEYIDASGGAAVSCLGHSHPEVLAAMRAQLDTLAYAHTSFSPRRWQRNWPTIWSPMPRPASATFFS